jgi:hypothetical protein
MFEPRMYVLISELSITVTRVFVLGAIVLVAGIAILIPTLASYATWERNNASIRQQIDEYNKNPPSCGQVEPPCEVPTVLQYNNGLTVGIIIGSVIAAGGTAGIIRGRV